MEARTQGEAKKHWMNQSRLFESFEGYEVTDYKPWISKGYVEVYLEKRRDQKKECWRCGCELGRMNTYHWLRVKHLRLFGFLVYVVFKRHKRWCKDCKKDRSEKVSWLSEASSTLTKEMAFWLNRLTEDTSVLAVSRLEGIDKNICYKVDRAILTRMLQGYKIPKVKRIAVDEVYARSPQQMKEDEDRDDLFLTVIVDLKTHKVIWVSQSRKKEALDEFFQLIGKKACVDIEVVAVDQHQGYSDSVRQYCKKAIIVWDRFHLMQNFNEAMNEDRKVELASQRKNSEAQKLLQGKNKWIFLTKADRRSKKAQEHIDEVMKRNEKMAKLEMIKEHFYKVFECDDEAEVHVMMAQIYQWALDVKATHTWNWIVSIRLDRRFLNYFKSRVTTGLSEGINRVIKGLKWQAYGYRDMIYYGLKILQKCGYLNSRFAGKAEIFA